MSNEITNEPEIRFKGYAGDWEQRKLNELAEFNPKSDLPERFEYVDLESVVGTELVGHRTENRYSAPSRAQRLAKKNDVFYQTVRPYQKNNYLFDLPYDNYVFSTGYAQMRPIGNSYFLLTLIQEEKFVNRVLERSTGTSYPAINSNDLAKLPVKVPADIQEQQKVGTFFKQLDNTIVLHQRELDLLEKTKQSYLQKMFPKTGEDKPEIRFARFTDAWEQRKLGDESDVRDGTHDSPKYYDKGYPLVTSKNLKDFGLDLSNVSFISDEDFEVINKRSKVDIGDILFGMIGTIGNPVLVDRAGFAIKNVALIKEQKKILNSFLIQILKSPVFDKYIKNENAGGTQKFLSLSKVRDFNFLCPNIDEQNCISAFFKKLDDTITLHQRELDSLKEMKKSLLQKMFA